jgi:hypothetical protein
MREKGKSGLFACPCCGYATVSEVGGYEICPICFWEDEGQDDPNADEVWGGPNSGSLTQARMSFVKNGAATDKDKKRVRLPLAAEERLRIYVIDSEEVKRVK